MSGVGRDCGALSGTGRGWGAWNGAGRGCGACRRSGGGELALVDDVAVGIEEQGGGGGRLLAPASLRLLIGGVGLTFLTDRIGSMRVWAADRGQLVGNDAKSAHSRFDYGPFERASRCRLHDVLGGS